MSLICPNCKSKLKIHEDCMYCKKYHIVFYNVSWSFISNNNYYTKYKLIDIHNEVYASIDILYINFFKLKLDLMYSQQEYINNVYKIYCDYKSIEIFN